METEVAKFFELFITTFLGFFAVMNPIANAAIFVSMTDGMSTQETRRTAFRAMFTTFCIIVVFCLLGRFIFDMFGITLPALRLAGGILLFLIGYRMLQGYKSKVHSPKQPTMPIEETKETLIVDPNSQNASLLTQTTIAQVAQPQTLVDTNNMEVNSEDEDEDIAISPLALPILAGPGTITTAMNYSASGHFLNTILTVVAFTILCVITYFCFISGPTLIKVLGKAFIGIISRLMGLILIVIGMQMEIAGIFDTIKLYHMLNIG